MEFILLATAHFLALLSPGPDFFLIVQAALRLPRRYGIAVCAGIAAANFTYLVLAVFGLEFLKKWEMLILVLKYAGATYLVFLGIMLLRSPARVPEFIDSGDILLVRSWKSQFTVGFLSGILNPKNAIFYLSLFTVMVSPATPLFLRSLYALWMTIVVFCWDAFVVCAFGQQAIRTCLERRMYLVEKLAGVMLAFFGLMLPFTL